MNIYKGVDYEGETLFVIVCKDMTAARAYGVGTGLPVHNINKITVNEHVPVIKLAQAVEYDTYEYADKVSKLRHDQDSICILK